MTIHKLLSISPEKDKLRQTERMETRYFSLGPPESGIAVRMIRILFGIACISIAVFWLIFNIRSSVNDRMLWITILFLSGFGLYQVLAGLGQTKVFIQIGADKIILKKSPVFPGKEMAPAAINKIEAYPLSIVFHLKKGSRIILRFGTTYPGTIEPVKIKTREFCDLNNIDFEIITEELN